MADATSPPLRIKASYLRAREVTPYKRLLAAQKAAHDLASWLSAWGIREHCFRQRVDEIVCRCAGCDEEKLMAAVRSAELAISAAPPEYVAFGEMPGSQGDVGFYFLIDDEEAWADDDPRRLIRSATGGLALYTEPPSDPGAQMIWHE